jgi:DtxR family Mn-dependent transcriptional regulator
MAKRGKEDYLRVIYELYEDRKGVRSVEIAKKLNISKASVSEMLRKLASENLVKIKPYSKIFLTVRGKGEAERLFDKHFVIKNFVKKILGHDDKKAREEAHKLEHALSEESVEIISKLMDESYGGEVKAKPSYVG